jgi:hypothetical protein
LNYGLEMSDGERGERGEGRGGEGVTIREK